jgi:hypothetical protein
MSRAGQFAAGRTPSGGSREALLVGVGPHEKTGK